MCKYLPYKYINIGGDYMRNPCYPYCKCAEPETKPIKVKAEPAKTEPVKVKPVKRRKASLDGWGKLRSCILERDGFRCRICGSDPVKRQLHIHHIDMDRSHNDEENLVTLCRPCHEQVHLERYMPDGTAVWGDHFISTFMLEI